MEIQMMEWKKKLLLQKATDSKLFITCGTISLLAEQVLTGFGVESRVVLGMTRDRWNDYNNGHTLIEVYRSNHKKWILYDLDNNCFFMRNGEPLSFVEVSGIIDNNQDYEIVPLSNDTKLAVNSFNDKKGYEYDFFSEAIMTTDSSLKYWYSRVLQIPMIKEKEHFIFHDYDLSVTERMLAYSTEYKFISTCEQFLEKFYSDNYNIEDLYQQVCRDESKFFSVNK
jgi:hypothetical protein